MILPQVHLQQPCYDFFFLQYSMFTMIWILLTIHIEYQSEETTGGVYIPQGRIQRAILKHIYKGFLFQVEKLQTTIPF